MWSKFWTIIERPFLLLSSACSVISIVVLCFSDKNATILALVFVCLSLVALLCSIIRILNRFLEKDPQNNHNCFSSFINYKTYDGENIEFETYKLIQAKCSILQYFDLGFKWSGNTKPHITSDLQDVVTTHYTNDITEYDVAKLKLRVPILYNQTTVIHFRSVMNDAAHLSEPKVEISVQYPIEYVNIVVSLGYKPSGYNKTAKVERRIKDSNIPQNYELIDSVSFDDIHKQYTYRLINPEPGYYYRIIWDR
mgnify:CR=1 FL=1